MGRGRGEKLAGGRDGGMSERGWRMLASMVAEVATAGGGGYGSRARALQEGGPTGMAAG